MDLREIIRGKKQGRKLLLKLGFKECGKKFDFTKQIDHRRIHIKWCGGSMGYAGYFAHIEVYPHDRRVN